MRGSVIGTWQMTDLDKIMCGSRYAISVISCLLSARGLDLDSDHDHRPLLYTLSYLLVYFCLYDASIAHTDDLRSQRAFSRSLEASEKRIEGERKVSAQ